MFFKAEVKSLFTLSSKTIHSYDPEWAEEPIVQHMYGYPVLAGLHVGQEVAVSKNPSHTYTTTEHEYEAGGQLYWITSPEFLKGWKLTGKTRQYDTYFQESWTVVLSSRQLIRMNTVAAQAYLRALRKDNQLIEDFYLGEKAMEFYEYEMSR
jgi:hypothetical protein